MPKHSPQPPYPKTSAWLHLLISFANSGQTDVMDRVLRRALIDYVATRYTADPKFAEQVDAWVELERNR